MSFNLQDFDFNLPAEAIALYPAEPRHSARLLHVSESLTDCVIADLPSLLDKNDLLVVNNSRVIPAKLTAKRFRLATNGAAETFATINLTLHKPVENDIWRAFARPAKRLKIGDRLIFNDHLQARVIEILAQGEVVIHFEALEVPFSQAINRLGEMPLPPYIAARRPVETEDHKRYQTLFARHEGSVAAPTAGLHFDETLIKALEKSGVSRVELTLHVGAGTFRPLLDSDDLSSFVIHSERGIIDAKTAEMINRHKKAGGRVVAVGTTSLRLLESAADEAGTVKAFDKETDIFIQPGYRFKVVDRLLTNFHLPKSTLLMLVSAFSGVEKIKTAYHHAIDQGYRFYSFGDACLLERNFSPKNDK